MNRLVVMTNMNVDGMRVHNETWAQQLKDAMNVNGGDIENATAGDYVMHFLTFGFKILFALVPPAGMAGGWLCFVFSLLMIAILTAVVGDLAGIFGCLVGLKDSVTAITFVALGTSLPDTFASKAAAVGEKHADNAIGNITGSNSVNVFLGLGLPWLLAAIYHESQVSTCSALTMYSKVEGSVDREVSTDNRSELITCPMSLCLSMSVKISSCALVRSRRVTSSRWTRARSASP